MLKKSGNVAPDALQKNSWDGSEMPTRSWYQTTEEIISV